VKVAYKFRQNGRQNAEKIGEKDSTYASISNESSGKNENYHCSDAGIAYEK
jgi:hypothetical protein